ncbi:hypothetical protein [Merismopedia glauca]|uniref:hypothetical protein n=1 Tax=Merismopedia glauca TaxID=292586 RepID=UPI0015E68FE7|nr:hypothetical protein [Merismopedia glauca]
MSLLNIILRRKPETQLNSYPSETQLESDVSRQVQTEVAAQIRQIRENYYLEQRSFWYR